MTAQVAIVMPVRNAAPWLRECLDSIRTQTLTDWKLVAVDDHSSDDSRTLLDSAAEEDPRITWLPNPGQGIIPALQTAWEHTSAPFVTRMDADDRMPADKLERLYKAVCQDPTHGIATGNVRYFSENPISEGYQRYEQWLNTRNKAGDHGAWIYRECVIASPNWMTHRSNLEAVGGFEALSYPEDYDLVLRWHALGKHWLPVLHVTHWWREHPARTSRNSEHYGQRAFFELKLRHFLQLDYDPKRPLVVWGTGPKAALTASTFKAQLVPFQTLDLTTYRAIETLERPHILVAVYPEKRERQQLEAYLKSLHLVMGHDWWYL